MNIDDQPQVPLGPICVTRATRQDREPGMSLVLGVASRSDWPEDPGPGLFVARDTAERLVGAIWLRELMPGVIAVWPPRCEHTAALTPLTVAADQFLQRRQARLARALVAAEDEEAIRSLQPLGLVHITTIDSLVWSSASAKRKTAADVSLSFQPVLPDDIDSLAQLVQRTYEETLDCRPLCHLLRAGDVLRSYRHTRPDLIHHWFRVSSEGNEIGCLFVSEDESLEQLEIAYLGVVRNHRGRGWGRRLVDYAQRLTEARGCRRMVLAVDAANLPAVRLYREAGFTRYARQQLLAKSIG